MKDREKEYKEIFIAEALQEYDDISRHVVELEKNPTDDRLLGEVFRLLHNLKANAKAMELDHISELAHKLETIFSLIKAREITFRGNTITLILDGIDYLGILLQNVDATEIQEPDEDVFSNLDKIIQNKGKGTEGKYVKKIYTTQNIALSDLIYIHVKKLDDLLNLVGELIIDRDRILAIAKRTDDAELKAISAHLERLTKDLQYSVMDARLVSIGSLFNKFPKIVRHIALSEGKKVDLEVFGHDIQIDRNILQIITDPLLHIIRNAIAHGLEHEEERVNHGKLPVGELTISANSEKDLISIEIKDDGSGINVEQVREHAITGKYVSPDKAKELSDDEMLAFIFEPGFSLSKKVSELSGRGVGLDIVKNALDAIGGNIKITSEKNQGTTFRLVVPNSIAVTGALLFEVLHVPYAIPLIHTESVLHVSPSQLHLVGNSTFIDIKNETIPVIFLKEFFGSDTYDITEDMVKIQTTQSLVIVSYNNRRLGLIVDKLIRQQDVVIKPLQKPIDNIDFFGGVTLLGTGEVCLVLDVPAISKYFSSKRSLSTEQFI